MIESQLVAAFVWTALMADTEPDGVAAILDQRIYRDQVPQAAPLPAATVSVVSGTDASTLGGIRVFDMTVIDVRIVGAGPSYGPINPAAARVDLILQLMTGEYNGVRIVKLRRDGVQAFLETDAGTTYCHLIQTYRSEAFKTP